MIQTIELHVTPDEREVLRALTPRDDDPRRRIGPLRIEEVVDVAEQDGSLVVQVRASTSDGSDAGPLVDSILKQVMAQRQQAPAPGDDLEQLFGE